jgi:hypothetical protein
VSVVVHIWLRVRLVLFPSLLLACEPAPPPTLVCVCVCVCETLSKTLGAISTSCVDEKRTSGQMHTHTLSLTHTHTLTHTHVYEHVRYVRV